MSVQESNMRELNDMERLTCAFMGVFFLFESKAGMRKIIFSYFPLEITRNVKQKPSLLYDHVKYGFSDC